MGVTWNDFWSMNPHIIKCIIKGYREKQIELDALMHSWWGTYGISAFSFAIDHCLNGKKAKSEYIKEPILSKINENNGLTQEEIDKKELRKMLMYEEQWQKQYKKKGLPETVIM